MDRADCPWFSNISSFMDQVLYRNQIFQRVLSTSRKNTISLTKNFALLPCYRYHIALTVIKVG